ncbi:hypothetical protein Pcinc_009059 [Petrolisthes cinctipes]|uniref:Uncharacterized protein n=1 Tax=Petrolisthes cinctipes TaxID=88211 RepID=A0AAE1G7R0_PETCI|nr:hypothetical protein Pcinc_009059 [Petrolisthes cinctipes]
MYGVIYCPTSHPHHLSIVSSRLLLPPPCHLSTPSSRPLLSLTTPPVHPFIKTSPVPHPHHLSTPSSRPLLSLTTPPVHPFIKTSPASHHLTCPPLHHDLSCPPTISPVHPIITTFPSLFLSHGTSSCGRKSEFGHGLTTITTKLTQARVGSVAPHTGPPATLLYGWPGVGAVVNRGTQVDRRTPVRVVIGVGGRGYKGSRRRGRVKRSRRKGIDKSKESSGRV